MDIYEQITTKIVQAIEADPGTFMMPWQRGSVGGMPKNVTTGREYNGVNVITLWVTGMVYERPLWASYLQWQQLGCQVKKGERGSPIVYYSTMEREDDAGDKKRVPFLKHSTVFNADQVDGFTVEEGPKLPPVDRLEHVETFARATGAKIIEGGSQAFYRPGTDEVHMPASERFIDTKTSTRTEAFYSTLCHELTHWSGAKHRLARDLSGRFGSEGYAMEELVAELGAAFLCARLTITPEVRQDHAQYLANWLKVLKDDKKAIFTASAAAQLATDYLMGMSQALAA